MINDDLRNDPHAEDHSGKPDDGGGSNCAHRDAQNAEDDYDRPLHAGCNLVFFHIDLNSLGRLLCRELLPLGFHEERVVFHVRAFAQDPPGAAHLVQG